MEKSNIQNKTPIINFRKYFLSYNDLFLVKYIHRTKGKKSIGG